MALTPFQRDVCRLLARGRVERGESYVAGGAALNELLAGRRLSRDLDLFHDTAEALAASWQADRTTLAGAGYEIALVRERPSFVEAELRARGQSVVLQWAHDSAYRFFPLLAHEDLGLTLHPFDLATNKVLALVGRVEPRDFVDTLTCHAALQPLGYLAWAACGKDPGFSPAAILELAAKSARYPAAELASLDFDGPPPDPGALSRAWHEALAEARVLVAALPAAHAGKAVLTREGAPYRGGPAELPAALASSALVFHEGHIGGVLPRILR